MDNVRRKQQTNSMNTRTSNLSLTSDVFGGGDLCSVGELEEEEYQLHTRQTYVNNVEG